jgi:hypothetical protein
MQHRQDKAPENVAIFKYLETTVTNQKPMHEDTDDHQ